MPCIDLFAERHQRFCVRYGLGIAITDLVSTKGQFGGAAIAVRECDDALDVVQADADLEVIPVGFMPRRELRMHRADRATGHHKVAVVVTQLLAIDTGEQAHVLPAQCRKARVDTVDQHRFVVATCCAGATRH